MALSPSNDGSWHPSRIDFFLPIKALSRICSAKFRDRMKQAKLLGQIPADVWKIDWNVNCQAVSSSEAALSISLPTSSKSPFLTHASSTSKTAPCSFATESRTANAQESFPLKSWTLSAASCNTCCPPGFMKIRYYGFMNQNCAVSLDRIRGLIEISYGFAVELSIPEVEPRRPNTCPSCGGLLKLRSVLPPLKILRRSGSTANSLNPMPDLSLVSSALKAQKGCAVLRPGFQ